MYPVRHIHTRLDEAIRWAAILAVAAAVALAMAVKTAGATDPPARLPVAAVDRAQPMDSDMDYVLERPVAQAMQLWSVLMDHREGKTDAAIAGWIHLRLPAETEVWRQIALAAAHLDNIEIEAAAHALNNARDIDRHNAVVHYYTGLLRLEQAARAEDWNDAVGPKPIQLASHPSRSNPNTRSMLQLAAIEELEQAIRRADGVVRGESLVSAYMNDRDAVGPTVDDLLKAIGADDFVANSHSTIAGQLLESGLLEHAEEHLDKAAELGIQFPYAYHELGQQYRDVNRHGDAVRAYAKAVKQGKYGGDVSEPAKQMVRSLRDAVMGGF